MTNPEECGIMVEPCEVCRKNGKENCGNSWCYTNTEKNINFEEIRTKGKPLCVDKKLSPEQLSDLIGKVAEQIN